MILFTLCMNSSLKSPILQVYLHFEYFPKNSYVRTYILHTNILKFALKSRILDKHKTIFFNFLAKHIFHYSCFKIQKSEKLLLLSGGDPLT